jgi:hypothetical protein
MHWTRCSSLRNALAQTGHCVNVINAVVKWPGAAARACG